MEKNNFEMLKVYIPGSLPTGRELAELLIIIECALVWSPIAIAFEKVNETENIRYNLSGEEEEKATITIVKWNHKLNSLYDAFHRYLSKKYEPILFELASSGLPPDIIYNPEYTKMSLYLKDKINSIIYSLSYEGNRFNIEDFSGWLSSDIGCNIIRTKDIKPDQSVEFLFDIGVITTIFGLQEYPLLKDIVNYTIGVLRSYIGSSKKSLSESQIRPPELTASMVRLLGKYDDVHLELEGGVTPKMVLRLKSSKNSK